MLMHLPTENRQRKMLHARVRQEMRSRYQGAIPLWFLRAPYSGKTHKRIFSRFQENLARPVPAAMLRIVTGDNVHTV